MSEDESRSASAPASEIEEIVGKARAFEEMQGNAAGYSSGKVGGKGSPPGPPPQPLKGDGKTGGKRRKGAGLAKMLRHISGKKGFDLFATPQTDDRLFSKEELKVMLKDMNGARLSNQFQDLLSKEDSPLHFYNVALDLLFDTIRCHGFRHRNLEDATLEFLSHRNDYCSDPEMSRWMSEELVHVKYDLASEGTLVVGDAVPLDDVCLTPLDDVVKKVSLRQLLSQDERLLVILAGSWS